MLSGLEMVFGFVLCGVDVLSQPGVLDWQCSLNPLGMSTGLPSFRFSRFFFNSIPRYNL